MKNKLLEQKLADLKEVYQNKANKIEELSSIAISHENKL